MVETERRGERCFPFPVCVCCQQLVWEHPRIEQPNQGERDMHCFSMQNTFFYTRFNSYCLYFGLVLLFPSILLHYTYSTGVVLTMYE